jgi:hypothetical protein
METEGLHILAYSQEPIAGPSPERDGTFPHPYTLGETNLISSYPHLGLPSGFP